MGMIRRNLKRRKALTAFPAEKGIPEHINSIDKSEIPFVEEVQKKDKQYTKTEISRMAVAELRKTALNTGIDNAEELTAVELKKLLVERLGL